MVDAQLAPRILDFGLSSGHPFRGHLKGTLHYVAPEQLDPSQPIDRRTDVYALGVVLYELLCGRPPYAASTDEGVIAAIREGQPRLPVEIDPRVPEPLQAIALKAMERDPALRYQSALDLGADLQRYLDGRPVHGPAVGLRLHARHARRAARAAGRRVAAPAADLPARGRAPALGVSRPRRARRRLDRREPRALVFADRPLPRRVSPRVRQPLLLRRPPVVRRGQRRRAPAAGPRAAVRRPERRRASPLPARSQGRRRRVLSRGRRPAAAAAHHPVPRNRACSWSPPDTPGQLFLDGSISNRQLQVTTVIACLWCGVLALRTRTAALSTVCAVLVFFFGLSVLCGFRPAIVARGRPLGPAGAQRAPARRRLCRTRRARGAGAAALVREAGVCGRRAPAHRGAGAAGARTAGPFTTSGSRSSRCNRPASATACSSTRSRR